MENTIENKAKFFAQYYWQEIAKWVFSTAQPSYMRLPVDDIRINNVNKFHLELTPLSDITDEDAVDVGYSNSEYFLDNFNMIDAAVVFDYLRSKGYALPWMGVSVETLVEWGWIKLKSN